MSADLDTQLREYFEYVDETLPTIEADEVRAAPLRPVAAPWLRGWRIAPVAAAITVAVVLVAMLIAGRLGGGEELIQPVGPTVETTVPETTAPPTTEATTTTAPAAEASPSAVTWTLAPDQSLFAGERIEAVAAGPDGFVAVGSAAWHSPDGSSWSRVGDFTVQAIAHGTSGYVAVGRSDEGPGEVWRSADGETWSQSATLPTEVVLDGVTIAYGEAGYVIVGTECCVNDQSFLGFWISADGADWEKVDAPTFSAQYIDINGIAFGDGQYVAVGFAPGSAGDDDAVVLVSSDGRTWTKLDEPALSNQRGDGFQWVADVGCGDAGWVVVGEEDASGDTEFVVIDAAVWHSPDGSSWARVPHDPEVFEPSGPTGADWREMELRAVAYGDAGYIAVGYDFSDPVSQIAVVFRSEDGISWERLEAEEGVFDGYQAEGVAFGDRIYVAVGFDVDGTAGAVWVGSPVA